RVLVAIARFIERRLKPQVNPEKSSVKNVTSHQPGLRIRSSQWRGPYPNRPMALDQMHQRVRKLPSDGSPTRRRSLKQHAHKLLTGSRGLAWLKKAPVARADSGAVTLQAQLGYGSR